MTRQERSALGVVALLLALGGVATWLRPDPLPAAWSAVEADDSTAASRLLAGSGEAAARAARARRPLEPGERIDPNTAPAEELQRLPRVGPALAARIVARREERGPYRTLADLDSVSGVGPALLAAAAPHLTLPLAPSPAPPSARTAATGREPRRTGTLDLNSASAGELESLPGIGPALAARIVASRDEHGRFRSPEELERVSGIGKKSLERLLPLVHASP